MGGGRKQSESGEISDEPSSSSDVDPYSTSSASPPSRPLGSREVVAYFDLLRAYEDPPDRSASLRPLKDAIAKHRPGDWIEYVGGTAPGDYEIPESITLLLVGPRGSGKSSLVNRITRVFEPDEFQPDRAQVSHNMSVAEGTFFLQEYMVPRNTKSLCLYDTRSLSDLASDNIEMIQSWMIEGVSHGQIVIRTSDTMSLKKRIRIMARQRLFNPCLKKTVNFVIFVVNGVSVLKSMDGNDALYKTYNTMLVESFNYPHLSFQDSKPAVVVTHGDQLSFDERARVCAHLGEKLGIPPPKQIFDIPGDELTEMGLMYISLRKIKTEMDTCDIRTELAIIDMLRFSIEQADRNLPFNKSCLVQARRIILKNMEKLQFDDWVAISLFSIIYVIMVYLVFEALNPPFSR